MSEQVPTEVGSRRRRREEERLRALAAQQAEATPHAAPADRAEVSAPEASVDGAPEVHGTAARRPAQPYARAADESAVDPRTPGAARPTVPGAPTSPARVLSRRELRERAEAAAAAAAAPEVPAAAGAPAAARVELPAAARRDEARRPAAPPAPPTPPARPLSRREMRAASTGQTPPVERPVPAVQPPALTGGIRRVSPAGGLTEVESVGQAHRDGPAGRRAAASSAGRVPERTGAAPEASGNGSARPEQAAQRPEPAGQRPEPAGPRPEPTGPRPSTGGARPPAGAGAPTGAPEPAAGPSVFSPQARAAAVRAQAARAQAEREEAARLSAERAHAQRLAAQRSESEKSADERAADHRAAEARLADQRAADQLAADQLAAQADSAAARATEQRATSPRAAEQRAAEILAAEQRAAEQRATEQRAAEQRAAEQRRTAGPSGSGWSPGGGTWTDGHAPAAGARPDAAAHAPAQTGDVPGPRQPQDQPPLRPAPGQPGTSSAPAAWAATGAPGPLAVPPGQDPSRLPAEAGRIAVVPAGRVPRVGQTFGSVSLPRTAAPGTAGGRVDPRPGSTGAPAVDAAAVPRWADVAPAPTGWDPTPLAGAERSVEHDDASELAEEPARHHPYTWLHMIVLVLVAFVLGMLIFMVVMRDAPDPGATGADAVLGLALGPPAALLFF